MFTMSSPLSEERKQHHHHHHHLNRKVLDLSQPGHLVLGMAFNRIQRVLFHCHCWPLAGLP